ncbi:MAG TPA: hypothetical protein VKC66_10740 [Xanthobacteraceae bacterium]|nr:hypothetical protein [Xanthobacteraceae bacterium]
METSTRTGWTGHLAEAGKDIRAHTGFTLCGAMRYACCALRAPGWTIAVPAMKHYKKLLLAKLTDSGWELLERCDGMEWWLDESWRIRSVKQHWGFELLVLFLVDPAY